MHARLLSDEEIGGGIDEFEIVTVESARADAASEVARFVERSCGDVPVLGEEGSSLSPEDVRRRIVDNKKPCMGRRWAATVTKKKAQSNPQWIAGVVVDTTKRAWASRRTIVFVAQAAVVAVRVASIMCAVSEIAAGNPRYFFVR